MKRCAVCSAILEQFTVLSGLMGRTLTEIDCNGSLGKCTCAIPIEPTKGRSQACAKVAQSKDDVRSLLRLRPDKDTCLLVASRQVTGLHKILKCATLMHTFESTTPLALAMNNGKKPSSILAFHVPHASRIMTTSWNKVRLTHLRSSQQNPDGYRNRHACLVRC